MNKDQKVPNVPDESLSVNLKKMLADMNCICPGYWGQIGTVYMDRDTLPKTVSQLFWIVKQILEANVEMQENFEELYKFVHDFFDNLDLQEEVNKKLEEMLEKGELEAIISKLLGLIITPEMYGAKGDGITDDTIAFQNCLNDAMKGDVKMWATNKYLITTTLNIIGNRNSNGTVTLGKNIFIDMSESEIEFTGENECFLVSMLDGAIVKFGDINSINANCIKFYSNTRFNYIHYCEFYGKTLIGKNNCISIINDENTEAEGWINQNKFINFKLGGGSNGIYIENKSKNPINYLLFDFIGVEGVNNGIYLTSNSENNLNIFMNGIEFRNIRNREIIDTLAIFKGRIINAKLSTMSTLDMNDIQITYDGTKTNNVLDSSLFNDVNLKYAIQNGNIVSISEADANFNVFSGDNIDEALYGTYRYGNYGIRNSVNNGYPYRESGSNMNIKQRLTNNNNKEFFRFNNNNIFTNWVSNLICQSVYIPNNEIGNDIKMLYDTTALLLLHTATGSIIEIHLIRTGTTNIDELLFKKGETKYFNVGFIDSGIKLSLNSETQSSFYCKIYYAPEDVTPI